MSKFVVLFVVFSPKSLYLVYSVTIKEEQSKSFNRSPRLQVSNGFYCSIDIMTSTLWLR